MFLTVMTMLCVAGRAIYVRLVGALSATRRRRCVSGTAGTVTVIRGA